MSTQEEASQFPFLDLTRRYPSTFNPDEDRWTAISRNKERENNISDPNLRIGELQ